MHSIITELRRLIVKREKHTQTEGGGDRESETERHTCREYEYYIKKIFLKPHTLTPQFHFQESILKKY